MVDGNPNSRLLIIGMAPGRDELLADKPFVGKSGYMLWRALSEEGIDRADCYIINTIGEWPEGTGGSPSEEQYDRYWNDFDEAVRAYTGTAVLILGKDALWRATGLTGIEGWRGYVVRQEDFQPVKRTTKVETTYKTTTKNHKKGDPRSIKARTTSYSALRENVVCIPCLHPSAVLRTGKVTLPAFNADVKRAAGFSLGIETILSEDGYDSQAIPLSPQSPAIAFDIETDIGSEAIQRLALATKDRAWSDRWNEGTRYHAKMELSRPLATKVAHNISFDLPRLEKAGVKIEGPLYDTMLACQLLQPDLSKGLNFVGSMYLTTRRWKHESEVNPAKYNALDAIRTLQLYYVTVQALEETGQYDLFTEIVMPAIPTLIRMSQRGLKVDEVARSNWIKELGLRQGEMMNKWYAKHPTTNPNSHHQLKALLFGTLGMEVQRSKYGGITTDEDALRKLRDKYPQHADTLVQILDIREVAKDLGTYAKVPIDRQSCVHPSYLPGGKDDDAYGKGLAGTGRITAKEPNIQNQPITARRMYVPHNPKNVLVECDYSQIEARIIAAMSKDEALQAAINDGLHQANMRLLGVDLTRAKNAFYGWSYDGGARTLSKTFKAQGFNINTKEAQAMLDAFSDKYRKAVAWREHMKSLARTQSYLQNPFGRRRYFYNREDSGPKAANFIPQSTAADIMWSVLPVLERVLEPYGATILTCVHDSILCETPPGFEYSTITKVMETPFSNVAPGFFVPVAVKFGTNWGEMEKPWHA